MTQDEIESVQNRHADYLKSYSGTDPEAYRVQHAIASSDIAALLAHIREQEVYIMAGKIIEKFPDFRLIQEFWNSEKPSNGWGWQEKPSFGWNGSHETWESAVRDAYETLIGEGKE